MTQNTKNVSKPFNVDFMQKRSAYTYELNPTWIVVIDTYLMESKSGVFEHVIKVLFPDNIPVDVDRVVCVIGSGGWFSPIDSILEMFYDGDTWDVNYSGSKVPFVPGGRITEVNKVVFTKKVYLMQTHSRVEKTKSRAAKNDLDSIFKGMGLQIERPQTNKDEKKDGKSDKNKSNSKKKTDDDKESKKEDEKEKKPSVQRTKPTIPTKPSLEEDGNLGSGRTSITEEWFSTKTQMIPVFEKSQDYVIKYLENGFSEFMKASPGLHRSDMTIEINTSLEERVYVYDCKKKCMIGHIQCVSETPINVARFSGLTFAVIRIGE